MIFTLTLGEILVKPFERGEDKLARKHVEGIQFVVALERAPLCGGRQGRFANRPFDICLNVR